MKVLVLGGAGYIGSEATRDLVRYSDFSEIVITGLPYEVSKMKRLIHEHDDSRLSYITLSVHQEEQLIDNMKGFDIVINALPFGYDLLVIQAAIKTRVSGLDVGSPNLDQFIFDEIAKKAGITFIFGMGASPGITNVVSKYGSELLDQVEEIHIAEAAFRPTAPGIGILLATLWEFNPTVKELAYYEDGKYIKVPPFSGEKWVKFPGEIGAQKTYYMANSEVWTLPKFIKGLKKVTVRGAWSPEVECLGRFLNYFGFFSESYSQGDQCNMLTPLTFIIKYLLRCPEAKRTTIYGYALHIEVKGVKNRRKTRYIFVISHPQANKWGGERAYPKVVAIPLSVGAQMIARNEIKQKGVLPPEACIPPTTFLSELQARGIKVQQNEIIE